MLYTSFWSPNSTVNERKTRRHCACMDGVTNPELRGSNPFILVSKQTCSFVPQGSAMSVSLAVGYTNTLKALTDTKILVKDGLTPTYG
jgi:hypothetical protein